MLRCALGIIVNISYSNQYLHERGGLMEELIAAKGVKGSLEEK